MHRALPFVLLIVACAPSPTTVAPPPPPMLTTAAVIVSPDTSRLVNGDSIQLTAVARDSNGTDLTGQAVSWISDNPLVATVSSTGKVAAVRAGGPVHISAFVGGASTFAVVIVSTPYVARVDIAPGGPLTMKVGTSQRLIATPFSDANVRIPGIAIWWQTSDWQTVTVEADGTLIAAGPGGPVQITAMAYTIVGNKYMYSAPSKPFLVYVTP